jgi:predicted enzyme related to lactoylglutathione lyase
MKIVLKSCRGHGPQALSGVLLCVALISPGMSASPDLPPLYEPASTEHHVGKVIWAELITPDLQGAERFYSGLFGWTFYDVPGVSTAIDTKYAVARLAGRPIAGLLQRAVPAEGHAQPAWLTFLATGDADAVAHNAVAHGARILAEPRSYGRRGRQAILSDPEGAVFGILSSATGDAPDLLAEQGEWIWSSLLVRDVDAEAAFYQNLLGYEVYDLSSDDGRDHAILSTDDLARASVNSMPADSIRRHPHWINFVRVLNVSDAAARALTLGGRVLVEPHSDRHGGRVAIIADPQGAPFGVMEWSESDEQGGAK